MDINTLYDNARMGDHQAEEALFELLTTRFRLLAYQKIGNKADAEEVVQEAVTTIYAEYGPMTFNSSFAAWACKVLDNRILGYFRKRNTERQRFGPEKDSDTGQEPMSTSARPELRMRLRDCFQEVCRRNIRYARILNLHYLGFKTEEICERMSVTPQTLYSALSKARTMLEKCLERREVKP
jgi:RNA polymerase sigma factor (sigma-70 family)